MGNICSLTSCIKNSNYSSNFFGKKREKRIKKIPLVATPLYYQDSIPVTSLIKDISFQSNVITYADNAPYFINPIIPVNNYLTEENSSIIQPTFFINKSVC